jgi:hypothetical protein
MKLVAGLALVAAGCGLWGLDSWRGSNNDARSAYVTDHARQWLPDGGMPVENGELVVAVGVPLPERPLADDVTGFSLNVLRLDRDVEIYQWREQSRTSTDRDGNSYTTYSYNKVWSDHAINSFAFDQTMGHRNSGSLPFPDKTFRPQSIRFGDVSLDAAYAGMMGDNSRLDVTREMFDAMPSDLQTKFAIVDGRLFPNRSPEIGDVRVTYAALTPRQATVVGEYRDGAIAPATTPAGTISLFRWGNLDLEKVIELEKSESHTLGIVLKILAGAILVGGLLLTFFGLRERGPGLSADGRTGR